MALFKSESEEQAISPFAKCPVCKELILLKVVDNIIRFTIEKCPFCESFIHERTVKNSYLENKELVKAMQSAGEVSGFRYAIPIFFALAIVGVLLMYATDNTVRFLRYMYFFMASFYCLNGAVLSYNWLKEFGIKDFQDEEFRQTKKDVKKSLIVWISLFIMTAVLWVFLLSIVK